MSKIIDDTNLGRLISDLKTKITAAFWPKSDVQEVTLATVATTGSYNDLTDKPTAATGAIIYIGTCATAAGTATKVVTTETFPTQNGAPIVGTMIGVKFGYTNTASAPKLNVNSLGAAGIYYNTSVVTSTSSTYGGAANQYTYYVWDGTNWVWINHGTDANDNSLAYQIRTNSQRKTVATACYRYRILFTSADGTKWIPANSSTSTNATASRTVTTEKIDPFGQISYYAATTALSAGGAPSATYLYQQYVVTFGYSFNRTGAALTLTAQTPVYIKCTPQTDGTVIIDSTTPYVQALPNTADGKAYIFIGVATSATQVELMPIHPVYQYVNGHICQWTNAPAGNDGSVVHKSGDESLSGTKTFNGDIYINTSNEIRFQDQTEGNEDNNLQIQYDNGDLHLYAFDGDSKPKIIGVGDPVNNYDAANKLYVDSVALAQHFQPTQAAPYLAIRLGATDQQSVFITAGVDAVSSSFYVMPKDNDCTIIGDFDETDLVFSYADGISDFGYTTALLISSNDGSSFNVFNLGPQKMDVKLVSSSGLEIWEFDGSILRWNKLTFDSIPTANSTNPVTSGGVYTALSAKYEKPNGGIPATDIAAGVIPTVPVTDVTVGGTSVVSNGTAAVPAIPTVDTNPTSASTNAVSSGGVYSALANKANVVTVGSSMPSGGFLPNVYYNLGTVSGSVTWSLASSSSAADEYMIQFTAASTAPTITWPSGLTWFGGSAPSLTGGNTYQISIQNNLAVCGEF